VLSIKCCCDDGLSDRVPQVMQWQTKVIARKEKARAEMNLSKRMKDRKARLSAKAEDAGDRLSAKVSSCPFSTLFFSSSLRPTVNAGRKDVS
jgi:hypothetical protein